MRIFITSDSSSNFWDDKIKEDTVVRTCGPRVEAALKGKNPPRVLDINGRVLQW
jgi:hypothetical protein